MTKLLEKAFHKASSLPEDVQDAIAQNLIKEMGWESKWDDTLASSQDALENMGLKALKEFKDGSQERGKEKVKITLFPCIWSHIP